MYITLVVFSFKKLNQREYMYEKVEKIYKRVCYIRAHNLYESLSSSLALTNTK